MDWVTPRPLALVLLGAFVGACGSTASGAVAPDAIGSAGFDYAN